jgi:hypothetical protein
LLKHPHNTIYGLRFSISEIAPDYNRNLPHELKTSILVASNLKVLGKSCLPKGHPMMRNRAYRSGLILAILCGLVFAIEARAQSPDEQSLGDVARSQRRKQVPAKVTIDEDEMARRGLNHGGGLDCDSTCEAQVRAQSISAGRLQVTDAQWQAAFTSAKNSLAHDAEWLELIAEMKDVICLGASNSPKFRDWNERESKKTNDDIYKDGKIGNASMPGDSPAVNEARAKVAKVQIILYMYKRDIQSCPAPAPPSKK